MNWGGKIGLYFYITCSPILEKWQLPSNPDFNSLVYGFLWIYKALLLWILILIAKSILCYMVIYPFYWYNSNPNEWNVQAYEYSIKNLLKSNKTAIFLKFHKIITYIMNEMMRCNFWLCKIWAKPVSPEIKSKIPIAFNGSRVGL